MYNIANIPLNEQINPIERRSAHEQPFFFFSSQISQYEHFVILYYIYIFISSFVLLLSNVLLYTPIQLVVNFEKIFVFLFVLLQYIDCKCFEMLSTDDSRLWQIFVIFFHIFYLLCFYLFFFLSASWHFSFVIH